MGYNEKLVTQTELSDSIVEAKKYTDDALANIDGATLNVTKEQLGLGLVDNTPDSEKPLSTPQQIALEGVATSLREEMKNHTQEYVNEQIADIVESSPEMLSTLNELAVTLNDDNNMATEIVGYISELENSISDIIVGELPTLTFVQGGMSSQTGDFTGETNSYYLSRIYTEEYYESKPYIISVDPDYRYYIYYYDNDKIYIGNSGQWFGETTTVETIITTSEGERKNVGYVRFLIKHRGDTNITPDKGSMLSIALEGQINGINSEFVENVTKDVKESLDNHLNNKENPHGLTAKQIGAASTEELIELQDKFMVNENRILDESMWKVVALNSTDGKETSRSDRLSSSDYIEAKAYTINVTEGYWYNVFYYSYNQDTNTYTYKGYTGNTHPEVEDKWLKKSIVFDVDNGVTHIKICMRKAVSGTMTLNDDSGKITLVFEEIKIEFLDEVSDYTKKKIVTNELVKSIATDIKNSIEDNNKFIPTFETGAVYSNGSYYNDAKRIRTPAKKFDDENNILLHPIKNYIFIVEDGYSYIVNYFDINGNHLFRSSDSFMTEPYIVEPNEDIAYFSVMMRKNDSSNISSIVNEVASKLTIKEIDYLDEIYEYIEKRNNLVSSGYYDYESVVPENIGVLNTILNFKQLTEIQYTTKGTIPHTLNDDTSAFTEAKTYNGIPYSSTRRENLFVPNNVSLHTYMTAVQNPNSYLYTVDLGEDVLNEQGEVIMKGNQNGDTYYGAVCSTSCGYALNIEPTYSTHQWADIPGMEVIENQSVYGLKLGDTIVTKDGGHVVMVTDITKNKRGKIGHITITEAVNPRCKSTNYAVVGNIMVDKEGKEVYPTSKYLYCRYKKIYDVKHIQSPFVAVEDETPQTVTYNTDIIPRKGDKANWLKGTNVEIDLLGKDKYAVCLVYKDDNVLCQIDIGSGVVSPPDPFNNELEGEYFLSDGLLTISGLSAGTYKAQLDGDNGVSDFCYWMVVEAYVNGVAPLGDGKIGMEFHNSPNATPIYINWAGTDNGTKHITLLTDDNFGAIDTSDELGNKYWSAEGTYQAGEFKIRVAFKTDYGIIFSALPEKITVT